MVAVQTHDIFDTLIARRCIDPHRIFVEVEHESGVDGFARHRVAAERACQAAAYDLDAIYLRLQQLTGWSEAECGRLKALEVARELANAIPIQCNLERVGDGDLLVSDMYLPVSVVRRLLRQVGLSREVGCVVSSHGKARGEVWQILKQQLSIDKHRGNDRVADVRLPLGHGVYAEHTPHSDLWPSESLLRSHGLERLACLLREMRLRLESSEFNGIALYQVRAQLQINLPVLILAAVAVHQVAASTNCRSISFCSRDCFYLRGVYDALFASEAAETRYFYTSRVARLRASHGYLSYAAHALDSDTLVVDLNGTGWSLGALYRKLGRQPQTLLFHDIGTQNKALMDHYTRITQFTPPEHLHAVTQGADVASGFLEVLNYTGHGMVEDVLALDTWNAFLPVFESPNYPRRVADTIATIERVQRQLLTTLQHYPRVQLVAEVVALGDRLRPLLVEICRPLPAVIAAFDQLRDYHREQDEHTMWRLAQLPAGRASAASGA